MRDTKSHELRLVACAWAERKNTIWRDACDRVAMGFICEIPKPEVRAQLITDYRTFCHEEEKRDRHSSD